MSMSDIDRIKFLGTNLARQLAWIGAAESKISFAFTINAAMLGVLAAVSPKLASDWTVAPAIFASFSTAFVLASLLFLSFASFPRTHGPKSSLVYFGGIAQRDADQFYEAVSTMSSEAYIEDLSAQCHRNAEIANRKFTWVQRALALLYLAVIPWGLAIYLLYSCTK